MPLSKEEKENILKRLRKDYDFQVPDERPPTGEERIASFERNLEMRKGLAEEYRAQVEKYAKPEELLTETEKLAKNQAIERYEANMKVIAQMEQNIPLLYKPNRMNRTNSFSKNTQMDVAQIVREGLNQNVRDQDKRYKHYRESFGLTCEELAKIIGVSRKTIAKLEAPAATLDTNATSTVDPFFLEALSLVYYEDPYKLLDLKPTVINPLRYERITPADYIMNTLTAYPNDQMEKYLQAFKKLAALTIDQFEALSGLVEYIPAFKRIGSSQASINRTLRFLQKPSLYHFQSDNSDSPEYKRAELIQAVFCELKALSIKNPKTLCQLAVWASGGENILETLYALLIPGEFPERKDSVRSFASDEEYGYLTPHQIALKRRAANALQDTTIREHTEQTTKSE